MQSNKTTAKKITAATRKLKKVILNVRETSSRLGERPAWDLDPNQQYCRLSQNHGKISVTKINGIRVEVPFMEPCQAYFEGLAEMARKRYEIINIVLNSDDNRVGAFAHRVRV